MTSYESLADAAFSAAVDIQMQIEGKETTLENFHKFARLLKEPISPSSSYKLLHDARKLPLYKAAWSESSASTTNSRSTIEEIARFLARAESNNWTHPDKVRMAEFCLALSRVFIEENAKDLISSYNARSIHASS